MSNDTSANTVKIRVKVGAHEFAAAGPHEIVAAHFRAWQQLIAADPLWGPGAAVVAAAPVVKETPAAPVVKETPAAPDLFALDMRRQVVMLRTQPGAALPPADAALLLLHGFQQMLGPAGSSVPVTRLKAGLAASGYAVERLNETLAKHINSGLITKHGRRIGSKYQLTSTGVPRAVALAHELAQRDGA